MGSNDNINNVNNKKEDGGWKIYDRVSVGAIYA